MVVKDDPTLMFTNAGMNQFKDIFLGNRAGTDKRVADTQKCLRVSGKHNDLEEVGIDTYHHTMFEMLGNWSFGDYFKHEAIQWAWELLVDGLQDRSGAHLRHLLRGRQGRQARCRRGGKALWQKHLPNDHILPFSRKDNFWEMGDTGPCGPCSEIHVDIRSAEEKKAKPGSELVNTGHPQVIEIWNLVFIQFDRRADGSLHALPAKHVDTGMGFERLCMVLQGKKSNYDTDVFQPIIGAIAKQCGKRYGVDEKSDVAMRVIADHLRAISFAIADGQLPSNTGAGYVIRRILRRAVRYGYSFLGLNEPFLHELVATLVGEMGGQFPELTGQRALIENVMLEEEKAFLRTLAQGTARLEQMLKGGDGSIPGDKAFELFDTYGFPIDLTRLMAREQGREVDMTAFEAELKKQKERSRAATKVEAGDWKEVGTGNTEFVGYEQLSCEARILRYRKVTGKDGDRWQVVLDRTPFYAESGGQVGDTGWLVQGGQRVEVLDTKKENQLIVHFCRSLPDDPSAAVTALVDAGRRALIMRNHTATHLLHHALRKRLGQHVEQKGSLVAPDRLRFDISHFAKITPEELAQVEAETNALVREDLKLETRETAIAEAKAMGAIALFGEKYGDRVRVVKFGPSIELCGGTHVPRTSEIGPFRIVSESALAAGVRRIEAITSVAAENWISDRLAVLDRMRALLKDPADPVLALEKLQEHNAALTKQLEKATKEKVNDLANVLPTKAKATSKGMKLVVELLELDAQGLKDLSFTLRERHPDLAFVSGAVHDGKPLLAVSIGQAFAGATGATAVGIIRQISPEIKGGGGGQPDFATAGGKEPGGVANALKKAAELLG
jgi:alanyl-tRNA synthetase